MIVEKKKIGIVGGGAAGMMAAASFANVGKEVEVFLFEKNAYLGAKVLISGGGRCNVTTGIFDVRKLLQNYPRGAKFLMSAMYRFSPEKVMEWFETRGVPLKTESDLRVFPVSNNGKDIVGAFETELQKANVKIMLNANVIQVKKAAEKFLLELKDGKQFELDYLILTTGGNAYRQTGSTGDGYAFAKELGHTLTNFAPSLSSFVVEEKWISALAGVSIPKAELTLTAYSSQNIDVSSKKIVSEKLNSAPKKYTRTGAFLFTHRGVTGPAIFALSAQAAYENYIREKPLELCINFFPDKKPEVLKKFFQELLQKNPKKHLVNFLDLFLPHSLCQVFVEILQIDAHVLMAEIKKEQIIAILKLLQNFRMHIIGRSAGDEFVTAGGVKLEEVNTNTMESKICPNLYFAGEILDIDGYTGGFNLQGSWSTGKLAGETIATLLENL